MRANTARVARDTDVRGESEFMMRFVSTKLVGLGPFALEFDMPSSWQSHAHCEQ